MKFLSKFSTRLSRAVLTAVLLASGLVPMAGLLAPATVSAAPCSAGGGGAGGGGFHPLNLTAKSGAVDSAVQKIGVELTPQAAWTSNDSLGTTYANRLFFADSGCATVNNSNISFSIDGSRNLRVNLFDSTHVGAYVATTDYDNLFSGVTFGGSDTSGYIDYTIPAIAAGTAQLISVDLSNSGWIDVYLKTGSGSDDLLVSFKAASGVVSFLNLGGAGVGITYSGGLDPTYTSCTQVTGSAEVLMRVLFDDVATDLTAVPTTGVDCPTFDKTSYDSSIKTASLKYDVAGAAVNHVIKDAINIPVLKTSGTTLQYSTTLNLDAGNAYFTDYFSTGTSSTQQLYFTTVESQDGKAIPKNTPWPIAGGVFDLATSDVDLMGNGVVLDTSPAAFSAVAHNLNKVTKDGTFTLFVPYRDGDKYVGVCIGATDIAAVTSKCNGIYYIKDGQTKKHSDTNSIPAGHSVKAAVITVGTKKFWQVDGLTGSGSFSSNIASDPATGISINTTSTPVIITIMLVTVGLALSARRYAYAKKK